MLTLEAILKATKQMSSYGEGGVRGALDHLPDRVQGRPEPRDIEVVCDEETSDRGFERRWDDELKIWRFD